MEETPARPASPIGLTYIVAASQILGLAVITVMAAWIGQYRGGVAWDSSQLLFNVHPLCMVIGMVFLQGDGKNFGRNGRSALTGSFHMQGTWIRCVIQGRRHNWLSRAGVPSPRATAQYQVMTYSDLVPVSG